MLLNLKDRFALIDKAQEQVVQKAQKRAVTKPSRSTKIIKQVHDLKLAYDEAKAFNLPKVQGLQPYYALIEAIAKTAPGFAYNQDRQLIKHLEKDPLRPGFKEMIREFRDIQRLQVARALACLRYSAFLNASFQGQDTNRNLVIPKYIYRNNYLFKNCYYLIPKRRPASQKLNVNV